MTAAPIIRLVSGDELEPLISAFLDDCALAQLSPRTIANYRGVLGRFHWWCREHAIPLDPTQHTRSDLRNFLRYLQTSDTRWESHAIAGVLERSQHAPSQRPVAAGSVLAYHRVLSRFYGWLVSPEEVLTTSPMVGVPKPKARQEQPDPFTSDELKRIARVLHTAGDDAIADRNRAIVAVLLDTGLRASELCALRSEDVEFTTGNVTVVAGKGNKPRQLRLGSQARRLVRRYWLRSRRDHGNGPLFLSTRGEPLRRRGLHDMTDKLGVVAGVRPSNPHRFRHTFAVNAIRAGVSEFHLQAMLGHVDLEMVSRYVKLADDDIRRASQEHSPLDHLKLNL